MPGPGLFLRVPIAQTGPVAERLRVREIDDDRCIIWRNNHDDDLRLRRVVDRANVA